MGVAPGGAGEPSRRVGLEAGVLAAFFVLGVVVATEVVRGLEVRPEPTRKLGTTLSRGPALLLVGDSHLIQLQRAEPEAKPLTPEEAQLRALRMAVVKAHPSMSEVTFRQLAAPALSPLEALFSAARVLHRGTDVRWLVIGLRWELIGSRQRGFDEMMQRSLDDRPPERDASRLLATLRRLEGVPPALTTLVESRTGELPAGALLVEEVEGFLSRQVRARSTLHARARDAQIWALRAQLDAVRERASGLELGSHDEHALELDLGAIRAMLGMFTERGAKLLCYLPPENLERLPPQPDRARVRELLQEVARSAGCSFVDASGLLPPGAEYWGRDPASEDHVHFSSAGHRRLAQHLVAAVESSGFWEAGAER